MTSIRLKFTCIYLVGQGEAARTEVRVTQRSEDGVSKPATCRFLALGRDEWDNPLGVLALTEEKWQEWYGKYKPKEFIPGMTTAAEAAEKMVKTIDRVFYGCPLCNFRTKDRQAIDEHVVQEAEHILAFFDVLAEPEVR